MSPDAPQDLRAVLAELPHPELLDLAVKLAVTVAKAEWADALEAELAKRLDVVPVPEPDPDAARLALASLEWEAIDPAHEVLH